MLLDLRKQMGDSFHEKFNVFININRYFYQYIGIKY